MGKTYDGIDDQLRGWIERQSMFFVASAPRDDTGHVNVSPKGPIGTLRVLGPRTIAYLDVVGSGAETIAHLRENGRIVVMLCAFDGPPRILRLHGRGEALIAGAPGFAELIDRCAFDQPSVGAARRAVIQVEVSRVSDSCGYGVPLMRFDGKRSQYDQWVDKKARDDGFDDYVAEKNAESIDGLPAI